MEERRQRRQLHMCQRRHIGHIYARKSTRAFSKFSCEATELQDNFSRISCVNDLFHINGSLAWASSCQLPVSLAINLIPFVLQKCLGRRLETQQWGEATSSDKEAFEVAGSFKIIMKRKEWKCDAHAATPQRQCRVNPFAGGWFVSL